MVGGLHHLRSPGAWMQQVCCSTGTRFILREKRKAFEFSTGRKSGCLVCFFKERMTLSATPACSIAISPNLGQDTSSSSWRAETTLSKFPPEGRRMDEPDPKSWSLMDSSSLL